MTYADMLRNSPLRRQRNEGQGEYDRPESYYRNQGIDGQPLPSISDRLQSMGMDSSIKDRPMLIPVREDGEWTAPEWFHSMARGAMLPAQAALGGTVTPLDTAMATADFAGGGLLSSKAIPNAVPDGAVLGATAWHGSPHKFEKLDISKIGTGEGAQAYGHGLYAAENPNVAKNYAPRDFDYEESLMDAYKRYEKQGDYEAMEVYERAMMHETPAEIRASALDPESVLYEMQDTALRVADEIAEIPINSNLYKLDIPDDQIAKMLDWDKPIKDQKHIMKLLDDKFVDGDLALRQMGVDPSAHGDKLYFELGGGYKAPAVSQALREWGIPGIKYLDQGSRTGGKGTSNFVLFADDIAKILERNDQPIGDLAEGLKAGSKLPMDEASRIGRAKDMGYTIDAYHGTGDNIKEFDLTHPNRKDSGWLGKGIYTTDSPRLAGDYSILKAGDAGPNIMPLSVSLKNPYFATLKDKQRLQAIEHNDGSFWGSVEADKWTQKLKALGHDGVILPYKAADVGASNVSREIVAFEPHQIRSKFAKFDPTKSKSGDILAGAGAGFLASQLMGQDPNERF